MHGESTGGVRRVRFLAALSVGGGVGGAVAFGVLVSAVPRAARADAPSFQLHWEAPAGCPDEGYVRGAIEQLLAGGPRTSVPVEARATVGRSETGQWRVRLATVRDGATGERALEAGSCRSLADATALIAALTIDPARVAANRPPEPADASAPQDTSVYAPDSGAASADATTIPPPDSGPSPTAPPAASIPPLADERPPGERRFALVASVGGDVGSLPGPAYGFSIGAALLYRSLRIEAYGSYWPSQPAKASFAGDGIDVSLLAAGARGCFLPLRGVIELGACSGIEVGAMQGQAFGNELGRGSGSATWVAGTALARASWNVVSHLSISLDVGLAIPFTHETVSLGGTVVTGITTPAGTTAVTFSPTPVVGRVLLGPEVRF